ncbi:Mut7-C RNAse domain-containing protein [Thermoproteota archaeon]
MSHRFLLDGMLGSLARWLRIIGYDTLYYVDKEDEELRNEASKTLRILVTRDTELYQRAIKNGGVNAIKITSDTAIDQLKEIAQTLNLQLLPSNTRCPRCNGILTSVGKETVKEQIPKESYKAFEKFWICADCNSIYWKGSHWAQIMETLLKITYVSKCL